MEENFIILWKHIADIIRAEVGADTYKRWFMPVELAQTDETQLTLRVPNNIFQLWIESNYMALLQSAIIKVLGTPRDVKFIFACEARETPKKHQRSLPAHGGLLSPECKMAMETTAITTRTGRSRADTE